MTSINQATGRGRNLLASTAIWGLCATACMKTYRAPALPANQLALVTLDSSARALEVDGLPLPSARGGNSSSGFFVGVGCRELTVKYEQSYFIWGEKKAERAGLGTGLAATLANTEQHNYETLKPIRFLIPARAGRNYWVTATFTGDEFLPRIVESDPNGNTVRKFLPDEPCEGASSAPAAALPAPSPGP
jgi:hypothetical protein